jgi:hypothetical protein
VEWIMDNLLKNFFVRLAVAAMTIASVVFYLHKVPLDLNNNIDHVFFYQNIWLYSSFIVAFAITGLIFVYVVWMSFDFVVPILKGPAILAFIITLLLGFLLLIPFIGPGLNRHPFEFHLVAVAIPVFVFIIDWRFEKTGYFPEMKEKWEFVRTFDLGVIFGTLSTFFICWVLENGQGLQLSSGFAGGAITFQLIMANLLFDPAIYRIELPAGERYRARRHQGR